MTRKSTPLRKYSFRPFESKKSVVVNSLAIFFGIDYAIIEVKDIFGGVYNER